MSKRICTNVFLGTTIGHGISILIGISTIDSALHATWWCGITALLCWFNHRLQNSRD